MPSSHIGYTPTLQSIGLTREAVLKALGQDPNMPMQHQAAFEADQEGRYRSLIGNKHVTEGGKLGKADIALARLLRMRGFEARKIAALYGVTREAINKQLRRRDIAFDSNQCAELDDAADLPGLVIFAIGQKNPNSRGASWLGPVCENASWAILWPRI